MELLRNLYMNWGKKFNLNWYYALPIILNKLLQCANTLCRCLRQNGHVNIYLDILHVFMNSFLYNLKSIRNFKMKFCVDIDWLYLILIEYRIWFYTVWFIWFFIVELKYGLFRVLNLYCISSKYELERYNRLWFTLLI
jgi:hypothetical protein